VRICQAALVVTTRARGWERLVLRRAEEASARTGFLLSQYNCQRLRWGMPAGGEGGAVGLDVVKSAEVVDWLPVEHDWEDLSERHGVTVMPTDEPNPEEERRAARFFVNVFAVREALNKHPSDSEGSSE